MGLAANNEADAAGSLMTRAQMLERIEGWPGGKLLAFAVMQAWAALFGGALLAAIALTALVPLPWLSRYDWLFVLAIAIQLVMLATKLERPHEVITIVAFHLVGLGMEVFKTSDGIQAWAYHGAAWFHVGHVPLFSGFMYAAVGSYIARSWRVLQLEFSSYPNRIATATLALAIYVNFFTHHFTYDVRYVLFVSVIILYGRVWVSYVINFKRRRMPLIFGFGLVTAAIWLAENLATYLKVWLYPSQEAHWHMVGIGKFGSWFLLMIISFIMVDLLHDIRKNQPWKMIKAGYNRVSLSQRR